MPPSVPTWSALYPKGGEYARPTCECAVIELTHESRPAVIAGETVEMPKVRAGFKLAAAAKGLEHVERLAEIDCASSR